MAETSSIEWTDATWNPITGCGVLSPGCTNCYAMKLAGGRLRNHDSRRGLTIDTKAGPVWNGEVRLNEAWLAQPLRWRRPRRIFVCAHGDLFHEAIPDAWIDQVFAVMALSTHTFQVLTKRAARMQAYCTNPATPGRVWLLAGARQDTLHALARQGAAWGGERPWPLRNVWAGVSVEDQERVTERVPDLLKTPAAVRYLSAEPLLGPLDLARIDTMKFRGAERVNALTGELADFMGAPTAHRSPRIDWIIVGGESGPGARPMHPGWARKIRDDCAAAGAAFFFKQWGSWAPTEVFECDASAHRAYAGEILTLTGHEAGPAAMAIPIEYTPCPELLRPIGKALAGRELDGRTHDDMPRAA